MATDATDKTLVDFDYTADWANETVTLELLSSVAINSAGEVILKKEYDVALDANGQATDEEFPTPDQTGNLAWLYRVKQPDGTEPLISLSYNANNQDIKDLLAAVQSSTTPSDIATQIANKQDKDTDATDGNIAKFLNGETVDAGFAMSWNATEQTVDLPLNDNVTLQLGQEFVFLGRNNQGTTINNRDVVKTSGSTGTRVTMDLAQADSIANASNIGMVTEPSIANNEEGFATIAGKVRGIDTSAWSEGDVLYLSTSTPGELTDTKPTWPDIIVAVAQVERSHPSDGILLVRAYETAAGAHEKAAAAQVAAEANSYLRSDKSYLHADWYADDIQAALDAAETAKIPVVRLNPTKTYNITTTINIPAEIMLDGGGRNNTSRGATAVNNIAKIQATSDITGAMVSLSDFSGIQGCWIDGNGQTVDRAIDAVNASGIVIRPRIVDNFIDDVTDGIRLGGATYYYIARNGFYMISGIGLDALASYSGVLYGMNVGITELNEFKGDTGHVRFEGIWTSISDDFEGAPTTANIENGSGVSSYATLIEPYSESSRIFYKSSGTVSLRIVGGYISGTGLAGSNCFNFDTPPARVRINGGFYTKYETMFAGTIPTGGFVVDKSTTFSNYTDIGLDSMTLYSVGYARGMDVKIASELSYDGDEKAWTTASSFDCMLNKFHRMALSPAGTINPSTASTRLIRGHIFTIQFDGNTTLNHHASTFNRFRLAKSANCTPPAGATISFVTDSLNGAKEIGDYTARL